MGKKRRNKRGQTKQNNQQKQKDINKAQVNVVISLARALGCDVEDIME